MFRNLFAGVFIAFFAASSAFADCKKGQVRPPLERYEFSGESATDKRTRLEWRRCSIGQEWQSGGCVGEVAELTWVDAMGEAQNGWRLPSREELGTILSSTCSNPAVNEEVFPGIDPGLPLYWSSTKDGAGAWLVDFGNGSERKYAGTTMRSAVRLVKGGHSAAGAK